MPDSMEKPNSNPNGKQELEAATERARIAREKFLQKHPLKPRTLEEEFGEEAAARMRGEAKINALKDGKID